MKRGNTGVTILVQICSLEHNKRTSLCTQELHKRQLLLCRGQRENEMVPYAKQYSELLIRYYFQVIPYDIMFHCISQRWKCHSFLRTEYFNNLYLGCLCVHKQQEQAAPQGKGSRMLSTTRCTRQRPCWQEHSPAVPNQSKQNTLVTLTRSDTVPWLPDKSTVMRKVCSNFMKSVHGSGWVSGSTGHMARQGMGTAHLRQGPSHLKCSSQANGQSPCWGFFQVIFKQLYLHIFKARQLFLELGPEARQPNPWERGKSI